MQLLNLKTRVVIPQPVLSRKKIFTLESSGDVFSICQTNFGHSGGSKTTLQTRQKRNQTKQNFEVRDIVLVHDDIIQNKLPMARILKMYSDKEGLVQSVLLVTGRTNCTNKEVSIFDWPVHKVVVLVENELPKAIFKNIGQYLDGRSVTV